MLGQGNGGGCGSRGFPFVWGFFALVPVVWFFVGFFFFILSNQREKAKRPACLASGPTVRGTKAGNAETVPSSCRASRLSYLHKTAERDIIGLINPARLPGLFPRSLCFSEGGTGKTQDGSVTGGAFPGTGGRWSPKARPGSALARAGGAQRAGRGSPRRPGGAARSFPGVGEGASAAARESREPGDEAGTAASGRGRKCSRVHSTNRSFAVYRAGIVLAPVPHCAALDVVPGIVRRLGMPCINCSQRLVERTLGSWGCAAFAQLLERSRGCSVSRKFPCAGKIEF